MSRKALFIAAKDLSIRVRDRRAAVVLLVMPMVLIFILGLVFNPLWRGTAEIQRIPVVVVDQDQGEIARLLVEQVLGTGAIGRMLRVDHTGQPAAARDMVMRGRRAAGLVIPRGFSQAVMTGRPARLTLFTDPAQSIRAGIIHSIVNRFGAEVVKRQVAITVAAETLIIERIMVPSRVGAAIPGWLKDVEQFTGRQAVAIAEERGSGPRFPAAIDYYAVGMGVMYLLFGVSMASQSILVERREGTLARLRTTPTESADIVGGKLLATFLTGLAQFSLLVLFTRIFYGVQWGSPLLLIMMIGATALAAAGLGTFLAALARTPEVVESLAPAIILPMSFLGGAMFPIYVMPPWLEHVSRLTFNRWAMDGFLAIMAGAETPAAIWQPLLALFAMSLVFLTVGTWRLRFR